MKTTVFVRLPKALVTHVRRLVPKRLRTRSGKAIAWALDRWVDDRREELVDREIVKMGKDPHVLAECRGINDEFAQCDADGLKGL